VFWWRELSPAKRIFFVRQTQLEKLEPHEELPVRITAELLQASAIALLDHAAAAGEPDGGARRV
jgi:hypothetical protein